MVAVKRLLAPAALPSSTDQLSVMTYNVLLPNSIDGWWNYKMYLPPLQLRDDDRDEEDISTWSYRSKLLRERIGLVDADVVCIQEISPDSFEDDFAFMKDDLGYDGVELFKKGRFRPATFWKKSRCDLAAPPIHKDRTLLTAFKLHKSNQNNNNDTDETNKTWYVLNCHLQAGGQAPRRLRQINEGVTAVVKLGRKLKEKDPTNPCLVVCGDFNGDSECAAIHYLESGVVDSDFVEDGQPVTSKSKKIPLHSPMKDASSLPELERSAPPTLVVSELISLMVKEETETYGKPQLSNDLVERLTRAYNSYATHESDDDGSSMVMSCADVERWLIDINGRVGRGSEFRKAAREMGWVEPEITPTTAVDSSDDNEEKTNEKSEPKKARITLPNDGILTLQGFIHVYEDELHQGKFWGIAHDLAVMKEPLPDKGIFQGRYDRMYFSSAIKPTCVLDTISNVPCPNEKEPSDHLPIAATFQSC